MTRNRSSKPKQLIWPLLAALLFAAACTSVTQVPDLDFEPPITRAAFASGSGPIVAIDAAHHNFHTADGRYQTFAKLLRRDGFRVRSLDQPFTAETLDPIDILVISNALNVANVRKWELPTPSAFTADEVRVTSDWVHGGGSLLLIADHMPFPGAAEELAQELGLIFANGYASARTAGDTSYSSLVRFDREQGTLLEHSITNGRDEAERIEHVVTFGGQAFRFTQAAREHGSPLLRLPLDSRLSLPWQAGRFDRRTATVPAGELLQGAALELGSGRVAVFGEAAMFSAQRLETRKRGQEIAVRLMGMNDPDASDNAQFALNVMRWLADVTDPSTVTKGAREP